MDSYEEVFKDYPYKKLLKSIEDGKVDLDTNYVTIGQIYLIVRKNRYFKVEDYGWKDESEDLSMVKKILPLQLKTMFSPQTFATPTSDDYLGRLPNGLVIKPLDASDTYIMSCWGGSSETASVRGPNLPRYFEYVNLHDLKYFWKQIGRNNDQGEFLRIFQTEGKYNSSIKNLSKWGYIFKIPINAPMKEFINWNSNPFI